MASTTISFGGSKEEQEERAAQAALDAVNAAPAPKAEASDEEAQAALEKVNAALPQPNQLDAAGRGFLQGATARFSDEIIGAVHSAAPWLDREPYEIAADIKERGWRAAVLHGENQPHDYATQRDKLRERNKQSREAYPKTYVGNEMVGDFVGPSSKLPLVASGALSGAGASEAKTPIGVLFDSMFGGATSFVVQKLIGEVGAKALNPYANGAARKVAAAEAQAEAKALSDETKRLQSQTSHSGGENVHAAKVRENIKTANPEGYLSLSPGEVIRHLEEAAQRAFEKADEFAATAAATPNQAGRVVESEFAARGGSKIGEATEAAFRSENYREGGRRLLAMIEEVRRTGQIPQSLRDLPARREATMQSPEWAMHEASVLGNSLDEFPGQAARGMAAKAATGAAHDALDGRVAEAAARNKSLREWAKGPMMDRIKRYGPVWLGAGAGYLAGGASDSILQRAIKVLAGIGSGSVVVGGISALGGAGIRPGVRSVVNSLKMPAPRIAFYGALETVLREAPEEILGKFAALYAREYQSNGMLGIVALDMALEKDPEWKARKALIEQAMKAVEEASSNDFHGRDAQ